MTTATTPAACLARHPLAVALALAVSASAASAAGYSEDSDGELSSDRLNPTTWLLDAADKVTAGDGTVSFSNLLSGRLGHQRPADPDRDYVHIVVPKGYVWTGLMVGKSTTAGGTSDRSFIGLSAGKQVLVSPDAADAKGLLGFMLYGKDERGTDILDEMSTGPFGSSGFERPVKAGDYTVWLQELAPGNYKYEFDFVLTAVPEPATLGLWAAGLGMVGAVAARRRRPADDDRA